MFITFCQPIRCRVIFLFVLAGLLSLAPLDIVRAQGGTDITGTGGKHTIRGRIYYPSGRQSDAQTVVKLNSMNSGGLSIIAGLNGEFSFLNLTPGSYTLSVDAGPDYEPYTESVFIDGPTVFSRMPSGNSAARVFTVLVYLQPKQQKNGDGTKPGVLDVALNNVPKQASDLYSKGIAAARAGDSKKAVDQLSEAVAIFPDFPLALSELGVQYLKLGQPDKAADALRPAVKLSPDDFTVRLNYGIALLNKRNFSEAEGQLRKAVKLNEKAPTAHMYLGIVLINQRNFVEAEKELQSAIAVGGENLGQVHYYLGGLYWKQSDYKRAAEELEKYLKYTPNAHDAERVRGTIKDLRTKF